MSTLHPGTGARITHMLLSTCLKLNSLKEEGTNSLPPPLPSQIPPNITTLLAGEGVSAHRGLTESPRHGPKSSPHGSSRKKRAGSGTHSREMQGCGREQRAAVKLIEGGMRGDKQGKHGLWLGRDCLTSPGRGTAALG